MDPPQPVRYLPAHLEVDVDKTDAEQEVLRLWRTLPLQDRLHHNQAIAFAKAIAGTIDFDSLGNHDKIIEAWLVRDLLRTQEAVKQYDARHPKVRLEASLKASSARQDAGANASAGANAPKTNASKTNAPKTTTQQTGRSAPRRAS